MCSAVRRRMLVNGTTLSFWPATGTGPACAALAAGTQMPSVRLERRPARGASLLERPVDGRPAPVRAFAVDRRQHVIAGDPASGARPLYLGGVEPVLGDEPADHRGQQLARPTLGGRARRALVRWTGTRPGRRPGRGLRLSRLPALAAAAGRRLGARAHGRRQPRPAPSRHLRPLLRPAAAAAVAGGAALSGRLCGHSLAAWRAAAGGAAAPPWPMTANLVPTETVSPSWTRISSTVPLTGEGTSESTLSVETSKRTSSSTTVVADPLVPFGDGALGDSLTELGHRDFSQRVDLFRPGRALSRRIPLTMTGAVARSGRLLLPWPPS